MPKKQPETPEAKLAQKWITELEASEKWQETWVQRGKRIVRRYRNEMWRPQGSDADTLGPTGRRFAILWSNVQTLGPAIYARTPKPIVTRRYKDPDPVGRYASEVLERALTFAIDQYDFDTRMKECRDDYLLPGRGQLWVRYVPHVERMDVPEAPGGEAAPEAEEAVQITAQTEEEGASDAIRYQEALCDHVAYDDFGMQPCREWAETDYVWRRVYMNRAELVKRFGEVGNKIPLDYSPKDATQRQDENQASKKAAVYEIWDKPSGQVYWISKSWPMAALDVRPDPLGLTEFFPCPPPLMATTPPDEFIPVPDYVYYQDQAEELDELTQRIGMLTDALRMVGVYAGEENVMLQNVFNGVQNQMIPVNDWANLQDKGGVRGIIEWVPIDMVVATLKSCFETRRQILDDVYQITGLSDIIRGESDPGETATAQRLKGQWGSLRVRDRQKDIARFARDVIRLNAEVIAKKFTVDTLRAMTDVKLLTQQEKQMIQTQMSLYQQAVQSSQAQGIPPPPQPPMDPAQLKLLQLPAWEDVKALLENDALRSFRVDIETDSTVEPDEVAAKQAFTEGVQGFVALMQAAGQIVPVFPPAAAIFSEIAKESARMFRFSPTLEDTIETVFDQASKMPPQQEGGPDPAQQQAEQAKLQAENQRTQIDAQIEGQRLQLDAAKLQMDGQIADKELQLKYMALQRDPNPQSVS